MKKSEIKEISISLLIVIAIILLIIVICYDKISIGKVIPRVEEYQLSDEIKNEIEKVTTDEETEIITTYELDASDLKQYEKTKEYNKGKKNPFSEETAESTKDENTANNTSTNNTNTSSTNFYEDDGTK